MKPVLADISAPEPLYRVLNRGRLRRFIPRDTDVESTHDSNPRRAESFLRSVQRRLVFRSDTRKPVRNVPETDIESFGPSICATINKLMEETVLAKASVEARDPLETLANIRGCFEGKEAIYVEKGALRVRVGNIRHDHLRGESEVIEADIEEIPTSGLPVSLPGYDRRDQSRPLRWRIGTNIILCPHYSRHHWSSPTYVGWSMYFSPEIIRGVVNLASKFPHDQVLGIGYSRIMIFISHQGCGAPNEGAR
jgi:hypothetical protein